MKKRADGRYQVSIMVGYNDNGTPKRKVVYGKTQKEVNAKANELRMQHNMGIAIDSNITVGEWAETWMKTYKSGVAYKTRIMYEGIIRNYINKYLGHMKLRDVKTAHLQKVVSEHESKANTVRQFKLTISQMMEQAIINDIIVKNPAKGIIFPKVETKNPKRALDNQEIEKIKALALPPRDKCFIYVLLYTGARRGEVLALEKKDIDTEKLTICINKTVAFKGNKAEVKHSPKTKAGVRHIPILEPLKEVLFEYLETIGDGILFPARDGGVMSEMGYKRMWERFCNGMGTKEITAHYFRHNFATTLYNAGVDVKAAQVILGHSSISVTMDIYTHLTNQKKEVVTAQLNDYLTTLD